MNWLGYHAVLVLIAVVGVAVTAVFIDRMLRFRRIASDYVEFIKGLINILDKNNIDEALAVCDDAPGPIAAVMHEAILHRDEKPEVLHDAITVKGQEEISRLERRISILVLGAQLSPLLGLIGTLLGIREAVITITAQAPVLDASAMFGYVSGAVTATIAGLVVAVMSYLMHHLLSEQLDRLTQDLNIAASNMFQYLTDVEEG